jgi:hypothetical protein
MAASTTTSRRSAKNKQDLKQREDIFSNRREKASSTASEAQGIQKSLMRTQLLLKNESQRVSNLSAAIDEDGKRLQETMDHHKSFNTRNAQKALKGLERAQQQEQRILMASVSFFVFAVFYVMWSRVLAKFGFIGGIYAVLFSS